jgi:hypothetical protein
MAAYGVTYDVAPRETYDRVQVAIRIGIVIVLSILGGAMGWLGGLIYVGIPVLAAILISQRGAQRYIDESEQNISLWLRYIAAFYSYMLLLTDKFPTEDPRQIVRFEPAPSGEPTPGGVLVRIILAIPHGIVLALLGIVAAVLLLIAAISVLIQESYPRGIFDFLRGYMRWHARVAVYMAGLVQEYPPFALDTGDETPQLPAPSQG